MSITKQEIFKQCLDQLEGVPILVNSIDNELREALYAISSRGNFIKAEEDLSVSADDESTAIPTLFKDKEELYIDEANHLSEIKGGYQTYRKRMRWASTPSAGDVSEFALWNNKFYWLPVPSADCTVSVDFYKYHSSDTTTIEFGEMFRSVIINAVMIKLWQGKLSRLERANNEVGRYNALYEKDLSLLLQNNKTPVRLMKYRDI